MKLAIMQPYFFPYLGYFALIKYVNQFILFDTPQFIRHGWIERNRILKPDCNGWMYIKVPLEKHSRDTRIKDIKIRNVEMWQNLLLEQIKHYKKKARYYSEVRSLMEDILQYKYETIVALNRTILLAICKYLKIATPIYVFSEMNLAIENPNAPDDWALNIAKALNAQQYINAPGGELFFDRQKFEKSKIKLGFMHFDFVEYNQLGNAFESGLSILDAMMFVSSDELNNMLNNFKIK